MSLQEEGRGIIDGFRSRFRSSSKRREEDYDDYDDDYGERDDDYDDYDDYGDYDDDYDDGAYSPEGRYGAPADSLQGAARTSTQSARTSAQGARTSTQGARTSAQDTRASVTTRLPDTRSDARGGDNRGGDNRGSSFSGGPRLVSSEDVRASIPLPTGLSEEVREPQRTTSYAGSSGDASKGPSESRFAGRTMIDSSLPPEMTPEGSAAMSAAATQRHTGGRASAASSSAYSQTASSANAAGGKAASASSGSSYTGRRTLSVIRPSSYDDAEGVVRALEDGDVVILAMDGVPDALRARMLDFSFGAACALDATVERVGNRVFSIIAHGEPLSEVERMNLRNQGVI